MWVSQPLWSIWGIPSKFNHRHFNSHQNPQPSDIFERLHKESQLKTRKRENIQRSSTEIKPYHKRNFSQQNRDTRGQFDSIRIEDKLMQKHVHSQIRIENLRKQMENTELSKCRNRPIINSKTIEITKNNNKSKNLYQRQKEFIHKKQISYELKKMEIDEKEGKEFTGKPKINVRSHNMKHSNISQLVQLPQSYRSLCQVPRPKYKRKTSRSCFRKPPTGKKYENIHSPCKNPNIIEPFREATFWSPISTQKSPGNWSQQQLYNISQLSMNYINDEHTPKNQERSLDKFSSSSQKRSKKVTFNSLKGSQNPSFWVKK